MFSKKQQTTLFDQNSDAFLNAASSNDLDCINKMLQDGSVTVNSISKLEFFGRRSTTEVALYRLKNNIDGVRLLVDTYHVPIPKGFLQSTQSREVAIYLIQEKGFDPYQENIHIQYAQPDTQPDFSYFSQENIDRLDRAEDEPTGFLRKQDYKTIGETLHRLTGAIITKIHAGYTFKPIENPSPEQGYRSHEAPYFQCASQEDAKNLTSFLHKECGLTYYHFHSNEVYPRCSLGVPSSDGAAS